MSRIVVRGSQKPLIGIIKINGAKNSVLPIMTASLLTSSPVTLYNVPDLSDVRIMCKLLESFGAIVNFISNTECKGNHTLKLDCSNIKNYVASYEAATELRASILTLGPMLSRFGKISTVSPGGCMIGERPIDLHIKALQEMGSMIERNDGRISATTDGKLKGREITLEKVSVGATENVIMAATLAEGVTIINNAALVEPEVMDFINFLRHTGADINVINDTKIVITGVQVLNGCVYKVMPDRLEAGTYALAAAMTNGRLDLEGVNLSHISSMVNELEAAGCKLETYNEGIIVSRKERFMKPINIATSMLYPNFPTDMQPQFMSALCLADGRSVIEENVFEDRFKHVNELRKLGACISVEKNKATVNGIRKFYGTDLRATDIRATAALILASLVAEGKSTIYQSSYLWRGYEALPEKLNSCGADISVSD